jgi:hypothetical protein
LTRISTVGIGSALQQAIDLGDRPIDPLGDVARDVAKIAVVALDLAQRGAQAIALAAQHGDIPRQIVAFSRELLEAPEVAGSHGRRGAHQSLRHGAFKPSEGFREMLLSRFELRHAGVPFDHRKATI